MHLSSGPIVCGVDFSEHSRRAAGMAAALASALGTRLIAVTAIDALLNEAAHSQFGAGQFVEDAQRDLEATLRDTLGDRAHAASAEAIVGEPADVMLEVAARAGAAIIVVGTQGLGRAERFVFGSSTLKLMRATDRPVLAVPPAAEEAARAAAATGALWFRRLICGVDFGDAARAAARVAVDLGRRVSVPVTLIHAAGRVAVPQAWSAFAASASDQRAKSADTELRELSLTLGEPPPDFKVEPGSAVIVLQDEAAAGDPALVVLGLGSASGHRPGTTAINLLSEARSAVLTVPA